MADIQMISPPVYVFSDHGCHTVYGWITSIPPVDRGRVHVEPVVGNPDGPGIGPWSTYYGEDPWRTG